MKTHSCIHRAIARALAALPLALLLMAGPVFGSGWSKLVSANGLAPSNAGLMLLLSDGTVLTNVNNDNGGGSGWYLLSPDSLGHYADGTWTALSPMHDTRLFFSAQVLPDGRVYVAGAEYGAGAASAEIYDPLADPLYPGHKAITASDPWTYINPPTSLLNPANQSGVITGNQAFLDAGSEILPDGTVLEAPVGPQNYGDTLLYSTARGWSLGPTLVNNEAYQDEASWVKLPDDSILTIGPFNQTAQRFIPASSGGTGTWVTDNSVPVTMYDNILGETGPGELLPNGKAFFSGGTGNTVIYTPSGTAAPGTWTQGPSVPQGLAPQDAPSAMMNNGKVLCCFSPIATGTAKSKSYQPPTSFFEYDYSAGSTGAFTEVGAPYGAAGGPNKLNQAPLPSFRFQMLNLPDGTVLMSNFTADLYIYYPAYNTNNTVSSLAPTISSVTRANDGSYLLKGTLLNGISEGAAYGDDAQMSTNYPIVFLTSGVNGSNVFYVRTRHWSSTGVRKIGQTVTTEFDIPSNVPTGSYSLYVSANGLLSAAYPFTYSSPVVWVDFYYTGASTGSFQQPFTTLAAAENAVTSGGVIQIEDGGASSETGTFTKPASIYSYSGAATIGQSAAPVKLSKTAAIQTTPRIGTAGATISATNDQSRPRRIAPK